MKIRDVIRLVESDGWLLHATRGSHRRCQHTKKSGRVTIADNPSDDIKPGTLASTLKQAGPKENG